VNEARLEDAGSGLAPVTEGWFVVNVRDRRVRTTHRSRVVAHGSPANEARSVRLLEARRRRRYARYIPTYPECRLELLQLPERALQPALAIVERVSAPLALAAYVPLSRRPRPNHRQGGLMAGFEPGTNGL
jgi:hypothetical protein